MKKIMKEFETSIFGFKTKLLNVRCKEVDGEEVLDVDFSLLAQQIFYDLLSHPIRLTGNQLRFMRKHLGLRQEDMKDLVGIEQSNFSRLEAKGDQIAFENDIDLIGLKAEFAKIMLKQRKWKNVRELSKFIHAASEFKNPKRVFVRKLA